MGSEHGPVPPDASLPEAWALRSYREQRGREETLNETKAFALNRTGVRSGLESLIP